MRYGYHLGEDGDVVYLIYRAFSGQRPYIEFASGYTPGFFYGNAALFHLFGVDIRVLRWSLVAVNALAVFGLYRFARHVVPAALAVVPALGYAALMPVFRGEFATFNIPYPAWHVALAWVASMLAALRFFSDRRVRWIFLAGLLAGLGCAFKPNTGAFNLAAIGLLLLFASPCAGRWWQRATWWALLAGIVVSLAAVFGFHVATRDARLFLWPVLALALLRAATPGRAVGEALGPGAMLRAAVAMMVGFAVVTLPWVALLPRRDPRLRGISPRRAARRHGDTASLYLPVRPLGAWDVGLLLIGLGGVAASVLVARGRLRAEPASRAAGSGGGGGGCRRRRLRADAGGFSSRRFAAPGVPRVRLRDPRALGRGGVVAQALRGRGPAAVRRIAAVAVAVAAPSMFLSIYPRSDFFHWVLSAPMTLVLAAMLVWWVARPFVAALAARWRCLVAAPLFALVAVFAVPGVRLAAALDLGTDGPLVSLGLPRAPVVLESARRRRLAELRQTVQLIDKIARPDDTLLGFPNLHLLNFLSGDARCPGATAPFIPAGPTTSSRRRSSTTSTIGVRPLITVNHNPQLFGGNAPMYYFLLRDYVREHYALAASIGSFDVFRRRREGAAARSVPRAAVPGAAPAVLPPRPSLMPRCDEAVRVAEKTVPESATLLAACWRQAPPALQERAVALAGSTDDAGGARLLAWKGATRRTLALRAALRAVRVIATIADASRMPALVGRAAASRVAFATAPRPPCSTSPASR